MCAKHKLSIFCNNIVQGHEAVAACEEWLEKEGRRLRVVTQNIDELHRRAGSKNIIELHGEFMDPYKQVDHLELVSIWL